VGFAKKNSFLTDILVFCGWNGKKRSSINFRWLGRTKKCSKSVPNRFFYLSKM